jgi:hypothetical protein
MMHLHGSLKIKEIEDWEEPIIVHEVRRFLCLDNYYHIFFEGYSNISISFSDLLKKNKPRNWMEKCPTTFCKLKHIIVSMPLLKLLYFEQSFEV